MSEQGLLESITVGIEKVSGGVSNSRYLEVCIGKDLRVRCVDFTTVFSSSLQEYAMQILSVYNAHGCSVLLYGGQHR